MRKINYFLALIVPLVLMSFNSYAQRFFDAQAHRGGRGLMPENTILSEKTAIDFNCTMEMDLQMTKDKKIVVSHDAYLNGLFILTPEGKPMTKKEGHSRLIYDMTYDSLVKYDVGSKPYPAFPQQKNVPAVRPLLSVLIDSVEAYANREGRIGYYNIEMKTNKKYDGKYYSSLAEYIDSAMSIIIGKGIGPRTMIQSFDVRALRMVHKKWPAIAISYLVGARNKTDVQGYINQLGFKPDIFSPNYHLCTPERVQSFHNHGIRVIPWTPDTIEEMQQLKDMGVDGEITDYPDYYLDLK